MKKILAAILVITILSAVIPVTLAETRISSRASQVIHETAVAIRFSGGKVYGGGQITTVDTADKLGLTSIIIYEWNDGSWTRIANATNKFSYNDDIHSYTLSAPATQGKTYKVNVSFYGKIGSLTDTHSQTITKVYN